MAALVRSGSRSREWSFEKMIVLRVDKTLVNLVVLLATKVSATKRLLSRVAFGYFNFVGYKKLALDRKSVV